MAYSMANSLPAIFDKDGNELNDDDLVNLLPGNLTWSDVLIVAKQHFNLETENHKWHPVDAALARMRP